MSEFTVKEYSNEFEQDWDDFVLHRSVNGTFLQTRRFLNYHPKDRFRDASLLVLKKNRILAVIPACVINGENGKELFSHKGSTYGGFIIRKDYYTAERCIDIVKAFDEYVVRGYDYVTLKITADIHSTESSDLLQYALTYCGYENYTELNTYIDLKKMDDDVTLSFDRCKIRNIKKCEKHDLTFRELASDKEIMVFHNLLKINLSKYGLKPIHTVEEMISFKKDRIPDNIKFYGVFKDKEMMAGGMMFIFEQANVIHAQNLSSDYRFDEYSPITYMYYRVIKQAKEDGYNALSWGISTEDKGRTLNFGLIRNKESYGSKHQLNRTYFKSMND